jgi:hypothetical protein
MPVNPFKLGKSLLPSWHCYSMGGEGGGCDSWKDLNLEIPALLAMWASMRETAA